MPTSVRVFIVDDSAVVRQVMTAALQRDAGIEVIGSAADPLFALQKMARAWPDVIVLDVEMPRMDGITFLRKLMSERPTPVVICSTLTERGAATSLEALAAGAVEVIAKPSLGVKAFLDDSAQALARVVKAAARAKLPGVASALRAVRPAAVPHSGGAQATGAGTMPRTTDAAMTRTTDTVVALGTSTGGTQALQLVLTALPEDCPPVVVVQHMPEKFTAAFAARLNLLCRCEVKEAADGDRVRAGRVLIAPGGLHMQLKRSGAHYLVGVGDGPPINRHKPSVDVLFRSVARVAGRNALGVIMTGMGDDGARGLLEMRQAGAVTAAQDEASCVVFGMPKEAIARGAADRVLPLDRIAAFLLDGSQG